MVQQSKGEVRFDWRPEGLACEVAMLVNAVEQPICQNRHAMVTRRCPFLGIVLQKSKVAGLRIFAKNPKREAIADLYNLNRATEVAYEFNVGRCGPSHLYTKSAPVALRIFKHRCKTTFATQSGVSLYPLIYECTPWITLSLLGSLGVKWRMALR